jgi:hypothetical protein
LTEEAQVIVYGHIDVNESPPNPSAGRLRFTTVRVLKGPTSVRDETVVLCNSRPNTEWPDLSKLAGDAVLFLVRSGDCFNLSHNYRSVVKIHNNRAATGEIKGQPDERPLAEFLDMVRAIAANK